VSIYGIDPSLTSTGIALIDGDKIRVGTVHSSGRRGDTIAQRGKRIKVIAEDVHRHGFPVIMGADHQPVELVVIEGPSHGSVGGSMWDRAGLWWSIVQRLPAARLAVVPPQTRAKWVTGKGNADKAAVANIVGKLCPDVDVPNSDIADALALALMGAHALGLRPDLDRVYRTDALLKVQWPTEVAARLLEPYERPVRDEVIV
jgi:Holliday junction resolvasome RuvABC endonuclease subunit